MIEWYQRYPLTEEQNMEKRFQGDSYANLFNGIAFHIPYFDLIVPIGQNE